MLQRSNRLKKRLADKKITFFVALPAMILLLSLIVTNLYNMYNNKQSIRSFYEATLKQTAESSENKIINAIQTAQLLSYDEQFVTLLKNSDMLLENLNVVKAANVLKNITDTCEVVESTMVVDSENGYVYNEEGRTELNQFFKNRYIYEDYKLTYLGQWGPVEIRVGDGVFTPVNKGKNEIPVAGQENAWGNLYETTVPLTAGENTVSFAITSSVLATQPNRVVFNMDWFELEYVGKTTDTVARLEGESFILDSANVINKLTTCGEGVAADLPKFSGGDALTTRGTTQTYKYSFTAPYSGEYEVSGLISYLNNINYSKFSLTINGNKYPFNDATASQQSEGALSMAGVTYLPTKLSNKILLEKGINVIELNFEKRYQGNYWGGFDYIDFKYIPSETKKSLVFEAEAQPNEAYKNMGTFLKLEKLKTDENTAYELTQTFEVPYTGNYNLAVILGHVDGHTSPVKIKVNDGEYISIDNTEKVSKKALDYSCETRAHRFTFVDAIALNAGNNSITFLTDAVGASRTDKWMYAYIDKYELKPEVNCSQVSRHKKAQFF